MRYVGLTTYGGISVTSICWPYYLRRRLASEDIVTLGVTLSRRVCVRRIILGGEGNALYPVLCSWKYVSVGGLLSSHNDKMHRLF